MQRIQPQPVSGATKVVGVFGHPISHTLSPLMHNVAYTAMGLPCIYVPWHVLPDQLGSAVEGIRALQLVGVNVTIPHKAAVMPYLDEITPAAKLIGSVNTIENKEGHLIGHNTDAPGFLRSLKEQGQCDPAGRNILFLGAGGSAKPLAAQMLLAGAASVVIANRTLTRGKALSDDLQALNQAGKVEAIPFDTEAEAFCAALSAADILINATSVGMYPHHKVPPLVPAHLLHPQLLVCDIVYTPRQTALLSAAQQAGCRTLAGWSMLAYQGALAIEIWTGQAAPVQLMLDTLNQALSPPQ